MHDKIAFAELISAEFTEAEQVAMFARQIDAFASDGVEFLSNLTRAIGESRLNDGWNFS